MTNLPPNELTRAGIVAEARGWIGTPYHHQASLRGIGADCIGLVRGVYRDLVGFQTEPVPGYGRDWAEASGEETLTAAARRHLVETAIETARSGDVLVFRYRDRFVAKHAAILVGSNTSPLGRASIIHAIEGARVCEVPLSPWWRRRIAAAFTFPGVID